MGIFFWSLLLLLLLLLIIDFFINRTFISPGIIFNGLFFISLFLYSFQLSEIQTDLSYRTITCLWLTVLAFNFIVFSYYAIFRTKKKKIIGNYRKDTDLFTITPNTAFVLRWLIILIFIAEIVYSGGLPFLWKITGDGRTYFDFGIPSVNGAFYGLVVLFGAYSLFRKGWDKYLCLLIGLLVISRQVLLSMIVEGVLFALLTSKHRIRYLPLKVIIGVIILVIGFSIIGNFRTGNEEFLRVGQFKEGTEWIPTGFKWVYSYLTFSFSNFNNLVEMTNGGINHGSSVFSALVPTVLSNALSIKPNESFEYIVSPNFTVSTFYPEIYLDFGLAGIVGFSLFLGFIIAASYHYLCNRKTSRNCLVYAIIVHNVLFLTFVNMFLYLPISVQFVYVLFVFRKRKIYKKYINATQETHNKGLAEQTAPGYANS